MISREHIQALADEIASKFDVEKIILFGSHAYGEPHRDSDVDLLILKQIDQDVLEDAVRIAVATTPDFAIDLVVEDSDQVVERYRQFDPIIREAFNQGQVLYERRRPAVA